MYVAIEGIDLVGKSTQIKFLKKHYKNAIFTKEPGATNLGKQIRQMVLGKNDFSKEAELFLFLADRAEHFAKVIKPNEDKLIISDRSLISGIAYAPFEFEEVVSFNLFAVQNKAPDRVIVLTLSKDEYIQRLKQRGEKEDNIEQRGVEYLLNIQEKIIEATKRLKIEHIIIDANNKEEKIFDIIKGFIDD